MMGIDSILQDYGKQNLYMIVSNCRQILAQKNTGPGVSSPNYPGAEELLALEFETAVEL